MVSTPFRGRAGTSSWRLAEDPVEEQTFSRHVGEASDLDKQPAGCGSALGRKAALQVFTKAQMLKGIKGTEGFGGLGGGGSCVWKGTVSCKPRAGRPERGGPGLPHKGLGLLRLAMVAYRS